MYALYSRDLSLNFYINTFFCCYNVFEVEGIKFEISQIKTYMRSDRDSGRKRVKGGALEDELVKNKTYGPSGGIPSYS